MDNPEKRKKVVKGEVKEIKESEFKKFAKSFFSEDARSVGTHLFSDVVIPGIQNLIINMVQNGIVWIFKGSKGNVSKPGISNVSYSQYYINQQNKSSTTYVNRPNDRESVLTINMQEIPTREEAEEVLAELRNSVTMYGQVKVSEYYDLLGKRATYTDERYGWKNLDNVVIRPTVDGFIIALPPAIPLNIKNA